MNNTTNPLLFEMIRSFSVLAKTLNLSQAVRELGSTRQTVRRHIATLEEIKNEKLFRIVDRKYELTDAGQHALPEAENILARGHAWLRGQLHEFDGLVRTFVETQDGWSFYQQQQPISQIWNAKSDLLREAMSCWVQSCGELESQHMERVRPYFLVYRDTPSGWICVEVGEKAFYSKWWGWSVARSSIGRPLGQFPGGEEFARIMDIPYREVQATRGLRLDQVATRMPRGAGEELQPVCFQRLLLATQFPDKSFALVSVVDRPDVISISGLGQEWIDDMPQDVIVDFNAC